MLLSFTLLTILASVSVLGQRLPKPAAWPNLDQFGWAFYFMPRTPQGSHLGTFKAFTIFMDDCAQPWYVCREDGSEHSIQELVDNFSRVPVGMRQFINDVVHHKNGYGGVVSSPSFALDLDGGAVTNMGLWLHETSHLVDISGRMGITRSHPTWLAAYNRDTHVADEYAKSSHAENFAQYAGLIIYDRLTKKHLQTFVKEYNSIKWQIRAWADAAGNAGNLLDYLGNNRCNYRWPLSPAVNPRTGAIINKRESIFPRNPGFEVLELPELVDEIVSNCTVGEHL